MGFDPSSIGTTMTGYARDAMPTIMTWIGIAITSLIVLGLLWMLYIYSQYNFNVFRLILGENQEVNGKKQYFIKRVKLMKARKTKKEGIPVFEYLMSKQITEPIPERFIIPMPGMLVKNASFVYDIDGEIVVPASVNFAINSPATINFNMLPFDVKQMASIELQKVAKEYQEDTFMTKYGNYMVTILTVIVCCVLVGATFYMAFKYVGGGLENAASAAKTLGESFQEGVTQRFAPGG